MSELFLIWKCCLPQGSSYSLPCIPLCLLSPLNISQDRRLVRWNDSAHSAATGGRWGVTVSGWQKVAALSLGVWLSCMVLMTDWQKGHTHRKTQKTTFHPQKVYHHMSTPWGTKYTFVQKWLIYVESFEGFRFVFCHKPKQITFFIIILFF